MCCCSGQNTNVTAKEHDRLLMLILNPPPGSKIEAAKKFGIDLTLNLSRLRLSPTERIAENEQAAAFFQELRQAGRKIP